MARAAVLLAARGRAAESNQAETTSSARDVRMVATAANVADCTVLSELLHGEETKVGGDQAYRGQTEAIQEVAPAAQDMTHNQYRYKNRIDEVEQAKNRTKSRVRSKVEHVFAVMKLQFGFVKPRTSVWLSGSCGLEWSHLPPADAPGALLKYLSNQATMRRAASIWCSSLSNPWPSSECHPGLLFQPNTFQSSQRA